MIRFLLNFSTLYYRIDRAFIYRPISLFIVICDFHSLTLRRVLFDIICAIFVKLCYCKLYASASAEYWIYSTEQFGSVHAF